VTDDLGNVNNIIKIEEPARAESTGEGPNTSATTVEEVRKDQVSRKPESITAASLASPSLDTTPAETQSVASTDPIIDSSMVDTGTTTPLQGDQIDPTKSQPPVTHKAQAQQGSPAADIAKNDNPDDHRPRSLWAMLLGCCSRQ